MALALNDLSDLVDQLSRDTLTDGGVEWVGELAQRIVDESGLDVNIVLRDRGGRDAWNVEVTASEVTVALIDVAADLERPLDRVDQIESKASRRWRRVTREHGPGYLRPWIGAVVVGQSEGFAEVDEQLDELVRCRALDAAFCNLRFGSSVGRLLGIDSFATSLLGRLVYVRAILQYRTRPNRMANGASSVHAKPGSG